MEGIVFQFLARLIQQDAETEYDRERLIDVIYIEASKKLGDQATPGRVAQEVWRQIRQFVMEKKALRVGPGLYVFGERMVRSLKGDKAPFSGEYAPVAYRVIPEIPQFFRSNDDEFLKEQQQFVARQIFPKSLIEWVEDENWFCVDKDVIQRLMAFQGVSL